MIFAVSIINGIAVLLYACTSFGQAILFHIGWHSCSLATGGSVCNADNLPLSVIYISYAGVLLFPCQLYYLRESVDWPLAWTISLSQQFGLVLGEYVLFSYRSIWITRLLSLIFYGLAMQKVSAMSAILRPVVQDAENVPVAPPSATATAEVTSYPLHGYHLLLVLIVGFSSGVFGGLLGTGGPPLIWFAAHASLPAIKVRATFALGFLLQNMSRLYYIFFVQEAISGLQSLDNLYIFVALSASSMVALACGNVLARSINQDQFQVLLVLLLAGGSVLIGVEGMDSQGVLAVTGVSMALFALVVAAVRYGWFEGHGGWGCGSGWDWGCLARLKLSSLQSESTSTADNPALQTQSPIHTPTFSKRNPRAGKKVLSKYDTLRQEEYPPAYFVDDKDDLDLEGDSLHFNLDHTQHGPGAQRKAAFSFPLPAMRNTPPRTSEGGPSAGALSFGRLGSALAGKRPGKQPQPRNSFGTPSAPAPVGAFYSVLPQAGPGPEVLRFAIEDEDVLF